MCLEDVGRIAFPEYLASFLDDILREIPAVAVSVHTHLWTASALVPTCITRAALTAWIRRMTKPHSGQALSPRPSLSSCLVLTSQQCESPGGQFTIRTAADAPSDAVTSQDQRLTMSEPSL